MSQPLKNDSVKNANVYLDWAATAPLYTETYEAMLPYLTPGFDNITLGANANSLHTYGRTAFSALEQARHSLARNLGIAKSSEVIFTSGATEANNMAVFGIVGAVQKRAIQKGNADFVPHIITTTIEHDAILSPVKVLSSRGAEVTYLNPDKDGFIDPCSLKEALKPNTVLVSIQYANSEIGSLQRIAELSTLTHETSAYFHTDAVQALGKCAIDLSALGVDAASFSAHKIGGPKGMGLLYLKRTVPFEPQLRGGGQEEGRRSGTQNVCGAIGFAAACDISTKIQADESRRLTALRDLLYTELSSLPGVSPTVDWQAENTSYLPNIVTVLVDGFESETLILRLDALGYAVSGGSACSSKSLEPSHVITSLGYSKDKAYGSLRISMGRYTTKEDIDGFIKALKICTSQRMS